MAKQATGIWEAEDGSLFRSQDEATTQDQLKEVYGELNKFDAQWNGKQPVEVVRYLLTVYGFVKK